MKFEEYEKKWKMHQPFFILRHNCAQINPYSTAKFLDMLENPHIYFLIEQRMAIPKIYKKFYSCLFCRFYVLHILYPYEGLSLRFFLIKRLENSSFANSTMGNSNLKKNLKKLTSWPFFESFKCFIFLAYILKELIN